jgi:hypothetical protein
MEEKPGTLEITMTEFASKEAALEYGLSSQSSDVLLGRFRKIFLVNVNPCTETLQQLSKREFEVLPHQLKANICEMIILDFLE